MKLICDVCGEEFYSQEDSHDYGEPNVCSDACMWKLSNNGEPQPIKSKDEIFIARVRDNDVYEHGELFETNFIHGSYESTIFTATPFKRCIVKITIKKLRDLGDDE